MRDNYIFILPYQATAIGNNAQSAHALLKSEYVETLERVEGRELILKTLKKSMDKMQLTPENIEMLELSNDIYSQHVNMRMLTRDEIHAACAKINSQLGTLRSISLFNKYVSIMLSQINKTISAKNSLTIFLHEKVQIHVIDRCKTNHCSKNIF